jgi:hypothetical protein
MLGKRAVAASVVALACLLHSSTTFAQGVTRGTIAGAVRDATGAVLPGVTVEAASPALIEKVRSAVTDSSGLYQIVDLSPGVYTVTFTLPGFSTLKREGIELAAAFTATINADMRVGALEETITVTSQTPLVDVQSTTQHRTITQTLMQELPAGKNWTAFGVLIPGVFVSSQDVGGTAVVTSRPTLTIHGSVAQEMPLIYDGMRYAAIWGQGGGNAGPYYVNQATVEEVAVDTAAGTAEAEVSGVFANLIPKQGGNRYSGSIFANGMTGGWQASNIDDALRARGATTPTRTEKLWDFNPALGGPLRPDKLWFFGSYRYVGVNSAPAGAFYDTNPTDFVFTPDFTRPIVNPQWTHSQNLRLTWQAAAKHKLSFYGDNNPRCWCVYGASATTAYEASTHFRATTNNLAQVTWNWTLSNRVLIEAGETYRPEHWEYERQSDVPVNLSQVSDSGTGMVFRGPANRIRADSNNYNGKFAVSFVTGSHNLKVGTQWFSGSRVQYRNTNNDSVLNLLNGMPVAVTQYATPLADYDNLKLNLGIYVQERWTLKRLTLNLGGRFDYLNAYYPAQNAPAIQFAPARSFPGQDNLPNWKDLSPRLGMSYDLFGTGKTAVKLSLSRYVEGQAVGVAELANPMLANITTTRAWTDANRDYIPQESELSASSNVNFGTANVPIAYDPKASTGWGTRGNNWEVSAGVAHQLTSGISVDIAYTRHWFNNFRVTDNLLVTPADYDSYCVTAPTDSRLPGGGGNQVCGLYDINPTRFGLNQSLITTASSFGEQFTRYNGVDVNFNARLPGGVLFQGGSSTGRIETSACLVVDSPQALLNCDVKPPFQTQLKLSGVHPLPWFGLQASAAYQTLPGVQITASWAAPASAVTGLGRSLAGGARSATVPLVTPGTLFGDRLHQLDVRLARTFRVRQLRIQPQFDLYNMLNANTILTFNNTFGSAWQQPLSILGARMAKVGIQLNF